MMRIILKPYGVFIVLTALIVLSAALYFRGGSPGQHIDPPTDQAQLATENPASTKDKMASRIEVMGRLQFFKDPHPEQAPVQVALLKANDLPGGINPSTPRVGDMLRVTTKVGDPQSWRYQLSYDISDALHPKHNVLVRFLARSATRSHLNAIIERGSVPYDHYLEKMVPLTSEWREYEIPAILSDKSTPDLALRLRASADTGVIELADITAEPSDK